jgi:cell division protein FtsB
VKALTLIFVVLIALLQYPLWLGKGSWLRVWNVNQQIAERKEKNIALKQRNETISAEVQDLKQGNAAIEERARSELGMIKQDEVFYQVIDQPLPTLPANQLPANNDPSKSSNVSKSIPFNTISENPSASTLDSKSPKDFTLSKSNP